MKCPNCKSCTKLIRVELSEATHLVWYCELCENAYTMGGLQLIDRESDVYKTAKNLYIEKYGKRIEFKSA